MHLIGGADGCKGGWLLVTKDLKSGCISYKPCRSTHDLFFNASSLDVLALDIPIGLTDKGPRKCDLQARRLLKAGRASSVFPAPTVTRANRRTFTISSFSCNEIDPERSVSRGVELLKAYLEYTQSGGSCLPSTESAGQEPVVQIQIGFVGGLKHIPASEVLADVELTG